MSIATECDALVVVGSPLGWIALVGSENAVRQLTFGHATAEAATAALDRRLVERSERGQWNPELVDRLLDYAGGAAVDFSDVEVESGPLSRFQQRVIDECRRIPYGRTLTYGQLAARAGIPGAARAVGNCMAHNRVPLIIPCHRVVAADGRLGGFSAPGGLRLKQRLLSMEASSVEFHAKAQRRQDGR